MTPVDIVSLIQDAAGDFTADFWPVAAAGIGIGVVVWGTRRLWAIFKGAAK